MIVLLEKDHTKPCEEDAEEWEGRAACTLAAEALSSCEAKRGCLALWRMILFTEEYYPHFGSLSVSEISPSVPGRNSQSLLNTVIPHQIALYLVDPNTSSTSTKRSGGKECSTPAVSLP